MDTYVTERLRSSMKQFFEETMPHEVRAFPYIWDAIWQTQDAKCIEDFAQGHGWSFEADSISAGGISGGAFSGELMPVLTYFLYVASVIKESGDMIEDIQSFIDQDPRAPLLPEKTRRFLTQHGEAGLYALSNAIEGNFQLTGDAFEGISGQITRWYKYSLPDSPKIATGKLPESQLTSLISEHDFEVVIDETNHRVHRRAANGRLDDGQLIRNISANALGMLWLLISKCDKNYIDVLDFELIRASKPDGKPVGYRNFTNLFGLWIGREIAKTWHGEHVHGRIEIFTEAMSFLWLQKDPDPDKSGLLSKSYRGQS